MKLQAILALFLLFFASCVGLIMAQPAVAQGSGSYTIDFEEFAFFDVPTSPDYEFKLGGAGCSAYVVDDNDTMSGRGKVLQIKGTSCVINFDFSGSGGSYHSFQADLKLNTACAAPAAYFGISEFNEATTAWASSTTNNIRVLQASPCSTPDNVVVYSSWDGSQQSAGFNDATWDAYQWHTHGAARSIESNGVTWWQNVTGYDFDAPDLVQTGALAKSMEPETLDSFALYTSGTSGTFFLDNIVVSGDAPTPPGPVQIEGQTVQAVTDLVGFDVDRTGQNIIARTDSGATVGTYSAASLQLFSEASTPNCSARDDGVFASDTLVAYLDCDGSGDVVNIELRNPQLGSPQPEFPSGCDEECMTTIENDFSGFNAIDVPSEADQMKGIQAYPLTYKFRSEGTNSAHIGFTFTLDDGRIGSVIYNYRCCLREDVSYDAFYSYAPVDGAAVNICGYRFNGEQVGTTFDDDVVVATAPDAPTKAWRISSSQVVSGTSDLFAPTMNVMFSNSGAVQNLYGVSCGANRAAGSTADGKIVLFNFTDPGKNAYKVIATDGQTDQVGRTVALSGDTAKIAYYTSRDNIRLRWTSNGTIAANLNASAVDYFDASFYGMEMDYAGQTLWAANGDAIARFDLTPAVGVDLTTIDSDGIIISGDDDAFNVEDEPPENSPKGYAKSAAAQTGLSQVFFEVIFTLLWASFVGGTFGALALPTKSPALIGGAALLGAAGGLAGGYATDVTPGWMLTFGIVLLALCALILVAVIRR